MILGFVGNNLDFAVNVVLGSCEILGLCWIEIDLTLQRMVLHWTRGSGTSRGRRKCVVSLHLWVLSWVEGGHLHL